MTTIAIVAGGNLSETLLPDIKNSSFIIGVDKGAYWLISHDIRPDVAIGDFDSVSKNEFETIKARSKKIQIYPAEKDWTDLELALKFASTLHPTSITIYGGFGSRLDHSFAVFHLLEKLAKKKIDASIIDFNNTISIANAVHTIKKSDRYRYVSLLPLTNTIIVSLNGFKYNVTRKKIIKGATIGISNEIEKDEGTIEVFRGTALLIQSRD